MRSSIHIYIYIYINLSICPSICVCMYSIEAGWVDPVFLANGLTVPSTAQVWIHVGCHLNKRDYSGMVRWRSKILPLLVLAPARRDRHIEKDVFHECKVAQLLTFITNSYHEANNLQRQYHKMCIDLNRFETFIPATAQTLLYYEKDSMPLLQVKMAISWISVKPQVPELLRLLRLRWLPVPCRLLRRFPRTPFSSLSMFACDATAIWPLGHQANVLFNSSTIRCAWLDPSYV